mmetsp:Transcript_5302/g.13394  ORF Transcript_5302/g.13394 Transcript_5302/m.13394 type:complete len:641 (-) Transcript_5302:234-2156(-)
MPESPLKTENAAASSPPPQVEQVAEIVAGITSASMEEQGKLFMKIAKALIGGTMPVDQLAPAAAALASCKALYAEDSGPEADIPRGTHLVVCEAMAKIPIATGHMLAAGLVDLLLEAVQSKKLWLTQQHLVTCVSLANMSAHIPEVRAAMIEKGAVEAMLSVVTARDNFDVENQRAALIALTNFATEPAGKSALLAKGVLDTFIARSSPPEPNEFRIACQVLVLRAVLSLTCACPEATMKMWADGVDQKLLAIAEDESAAADPRAAALEVLVNITVDCGDDNRKAFFSNVWPKLVAAVGNKEAPGLQLFAIRAVGSLAAQQSTVALFAEHGGLDLLKAFVVAPENKRTVAQLAAIEAFANLCKLQHTAQMFLDKVGLSVVKDIIEDKEFMGTETQLSCLSVLVALTTVHPDIRQKVSDEGVIEIFCKLVADERLKGSEHHVPCLIGLFNIAVDGPAKAKVLASGAVASCMKIVQTAEAYGTHHQLLALQVLMCVAAGDEATSVKVVEAGVASLLSQLVVADPLRGLPHQIVCLEALVNLSAGGGKTEVLLLEAGLALALRTIMLDEGYPADSPQRFLATKAIMNLSMEPTAAQMLQKDGIKTVLEKTKQKGTSPDELVKMLDNTMSNLTISSENTNTNMA